MQARAGLDVDVAWLAKDGHATWEEIAPTDGSGERGDVLAPGAAGLGDRPQRVLRRPTVDGKVKVETDRPLCEHLCQSLAVQNKLNAVQGESSGVDTHQVPVGIGPPALGIPRRARILMPRCSRSEEGRLRVEVFGL